MLKQNIDKATFDGFTGDNAWMQKVYKVDASDGNKYVLQAEPSAGLTEALSAKQHEKDRADAAERDRDTHKANHQTEKTRADALEAEKRKGWEKNPDRDAIEADLNAKLTAEKEARAKDNETSQAQFTDYVLTATANAIAEEISTYPTGFSHEVRRRLSTDVKDLKPGQQPIIRVLDQDGKASATSVQELKQFFIDSPAHKAIIKASDASGGGAGSNGKGGGGSSPKAFKDMSESERTQLFRTNPTEFQRLNTEHQAASAGSR